MMRMEYCKKCGSVISSEDTFCRKCGSKIDRRNITVHAVANANGNPVQSHNSGKGVIIAISIVCGCIILAGAATFALIGSSNTQNVNQGDEYFQNKEYAEAADCYKKVNSLSGKYTYSKDRVELINKSLDTYNQAQAALDEKNYSAALQIANKAIQDYPDITGFQDIITQANAGLTSSITDNITNLYNSGDYAAASTAIKALDGSLMNSEIENIKNLIQGTVDAKVNSAQSSLNSKDYTSAENAANEALAIDPDNTAAKNIIATVSAKRSARADYISKLKSTIQSVGLGYKIYDIDKDGISDIVFSSQCDGGGMTYQLYVYENGNFRKIDSVYENGTFSKLDDFYSNDYIFASKKNGFYIVSRDCFVTYYKYEYRNGSLVENPNEEVSMGSDAFFVDGKMVSKQVAENNAKIIEGNAMTFTSPSNLSAADSASFPN